MRVYSQSDIRRLRAFGAKKVAARLLATRLANLLLHPLVKRLSPEARIRFPLARSAVAYRQTAGSVRLLDPRMDQVARDIYWGGGKPQNPADARMLRCVEALCSEGGTFYDVGSYSGLFAMIAARSHPDIRAVAFEIVPENYLLICRNVIANDLATQVTARLLGVGRGPGAVKIPSSLGLPSLASSISLGSVFDEGALIPLTSLDEFVVCDQGPYVMKIDVEGFEFEVLRGAGELIARTKPDIICELLPDAPDAGRIETMLSPLGYRFFQSRRDGFREEAHLRPTAEARDWLFSCRPLVEQLLATLDPVPCDPPEAAAAAR